MADRRRHLAQRRQFRTLRQRLLGHRQRLLHPLPLGDFPLQPGVQCAKLCRLALEQRHPQRRLAAQGIEGQRQQDRESHDLQRQNPVHPLADRGVGGEGGHAPPAERNPRLGAHHPLALDIGIRRNGGPIRRRPDRPLDRALRILPLQRHLLGQPAPARLCGQHDPPRTVGHQNRVRNAGPGPLELLQIDLDHDHPQRRRPRLHPARVDEPVGAVAPLDDREHRGVRPHRLDEIRRVVMGRAQHVAFRRRHRPRLGVQQHQPCRADLLQERGQPLGRLGKVARVQRRDQRRVARQQLRHDGIAAQLAQQVPAVKRQAQLGPAARGRGEPVGQKTVGGPDRGHRHRQQQHQRQPHPPADRVSAGQDQGRL